MNATKNSQFIEFLRDELAVPSDAIAVAVKHCEQNLGSLPMTLWQYGLVTLEQLDQIFDWLETA